MNGSPKKLTRFSALLLALCVTMPTSAQLLGLPGVPAEPASAEEGEAQPSVTPPAETVEPPPTLAQILRDRETARTSIRDFRRQLDSVTDDFDEQLAPLQARLTEVLGPDPLQGIEQASLNDLLDLKSELRSELADVNRLANSTEARVSRWEDASQQVHEQAEHWVLVGDGMVDRGAPESLQQVVSKVTADLQTLETDLTAARDTALLEFQRVLDLAYQLNVLDERVEGLSTSLQEQSLTQRSQPVWKLRRPSAGSIPVSVQVQDNQKQLLDYLERNQNHLLLLVLIGAVAAFILLRIAPAGSTSGVGAVPDLARMLERRFAVVVVLVVGTVSLFGPPAPPAVRDLLLWISAMPATVLLIAAFGQPVRYLVLGLLVAILVHPLHRYIDGMPVAQRLLWIAETAGVSALLFYRLAQGRWNALVTNFRWRLVARSIAAVSAVLLAISALAAIFGHILLARQLGDGVVAVLTITLYVVTTFLLALAALYVALSSGTLRRLRTAREHSDRVFAGARLAATIVGIAFWLLLVIPASGIARFLPTSADKWLDFGFQVGSIHVSIGRIFLFFAVFALAMLVSRFIRFVLDEEVLPAMPLEQAIKYAVSATVHYLVVVGGFILAALAAGIDLTHATFLVGAFSVGLGFGLQNVVNNFVSGLILMYERPIKVNDVVEIDNLMGRVQRIGIRSSTLKTFQGADVIVPNGDLLSKEVTNWTLSDRIRRIEIPVGVAYGSDTAQVMGILEEVSRVHPDVRETPAPSVLFTGFGDSSLDFELRCWVGDIDNALGTASAVRTELERKLKDAGIEIPFPHRTISINNPTDDSV